MKIQLFGKVSKKYWKTSKIFRAKLQRPLFGNLQMMAYPNNKKEEWILMVEWTHELNNLFGRKLKIYKDCYFDENGKFNINE